jgi:hypothetical protein
MASPESPSFDYRIDGSDIIIALNDEWLAFARSNGAPELERDIVIGRCLWEYVAGQSTQDLYGAIFRKIRRQRMPATIPFRCDSPDRFRFMQLVVAPRAGDELALQGRLIREQARPYCSILDRLVERSSQKLPMCSLCLRVKILGTQWVEAEQAIERLDLFACDAPPGLEYGVCDDCVRKARGGEPASAA